MGIELLIGGITIRRASTGDAEAIARTRIDGWRKYVGAADDPRAAVIGVDSFGESAPAGVLFRHFGITAEAVADALRRVAGT